MPGLLAIQYDAGAQERPASRAPFDASALGPEVPWFTGAHGEQLGWWRWTSPTRWGVEPYQRKAFDFQERCLNMCRNGGWGSCELDNQVKRDDCNGIVGRSVISAAARRMPLVRDVLKLLGSRTTRLPTDREQGLSLSARIVQGGLGIGLEAKW